MNTVAFGTRNFEVSELASSLAGRNSLCTAPFVMACRGYGAPFLVSLHYQPAHCGPQLLGNMTWRRLNDRADNSIQTLRYKELWSAQLLVLQGLRLLRPVPFGYRLDYPHLQSLIVI